MNEKLHTNNAQYTNDQNVYDIWETILHPHALF